MMICDERPVMTGGALLGMTVLLLLHCKVQRVYSDERGAVNGCRLLVMLCCVERLKRERPTKLLIEFLQKSNIKSNEICTDLGDNLQSLARVPFRPEGCLGMSNWTYFPTTG
ncbi:hypothetical protein BKA59DRAFT_467153 [Fusarium tricinctum]|uniref:Uncharacterized protein n=1 Tax=Fusarium tricinctum TaxID=61284 RepID=A0A8K0S308_9HYPO|nr:hypothetical protein BKA59DRAFT_467153 [Fusarium tricinctum]